MKKSVISFWVFSILFSCASAMNLTQDGSSPVPSINGADDGSSSEGSRSFRFRPIPRDDDESSSEDGAPVTHKKVFRDPALRVRDKGVGKPQRTVVDPAAARRRAAAVTPEISSDGEY
ncbi:MAG: hypothetical protein LBO73_04040 [Holosporaceae bacterium]|jgi:hypothetical protein|nr:hypothetical protein [Holosporaceae bacterium]